jgi:DNA-binding CsgD family transcriptional regulator
VLPQLIRYGLSVHADLVYRCLHLIGSQSAPALARALGLPPRQTAEALEELEDCRAVAPVGGEPRRRVWAAAPSDAFLPGLRERRARLAVARQTLQRHLSIVDISGAALDAIEGASPIANHAVARRRYLDRVTTARTEFLAMNPEAAFTLASAKAAVPASRSALTNGAQTLSLGVPSAADDESDAYASELYAYGLEYRELPRQPVKLAILDRRVAYFPINPSLHFHAGMWEITSAEIVDRLASFFLRHWEVAVPPSPGWRPPRELSDRERAVLAALSQGDTDDMVAQRLGLSSRTIRYVISDLMERYQVKTRFQLGLALGRLAEGEDT